MFGKPILTKKRLYEHHTIYFKGLFLGSNDGHHAFKRSLEKLQIPKSIGRDNGRTDPRNGLVCRIKRMQFSDFLEFDIQKGIFDIIGKQHYRDKVFGFPTSKSYEKVVFIEKKFILQQ